MLFNTIETVERAVKGGREWKKVTKSIKVASFTIVNKESYNEFYSGRMRKVTDRVYLV
jgi:hypothetical protein